MARKVKRRRRVHPVALRKANDAQCNAEREMEIVKLRRERQSPHESNT